MTWTQRAADDVNRPIACGRMTAINRMARTKPQRRFP
jgi:hypothetical protein